jgi:hypothetical protein
MLPRESIRLPRISIQRPVLFWFAAVLLVVGVFIASVEARPQRMHEPFRQLALEALRAAWPCK